MLYFQNRLSLGGFASRREGAKLLLPVGLLLLPTAAFAQSADDDCVKNPQNCEIIIADFKREPIIVTANGAPSYPERIGQAITVIERQKLETTQLQSVSDIVSQTPGITVARTGGPGSQTSAFVRGANSGQTLVLIDGVRVNDPSAPSGAYNFGNLLTGNIDRIEILRGPNSVPWGSQAIGGVISITTIQPTQDGAASLRAEYGSRNDTQFVGNISGKAGPVALSLGGGYLRDDGISAAASGSERDGYRQYGANGSLRIDLSDDINIAAKGYFSNSRLGIDGGFPFGDSNRIQRDQQLLGSVSLNARLLDDKVSTRIAYSVSDINRDEFEPGTPTLQTALARGRTQRVEGQADAQLSEAIRLVVGAEHETTRYAASSEFAPDLTRASTGITGVFGQLIAKPLDGLTVTGGVRYDDHRTFGGRTTVSANAAWVVGNTILRASYGEGFRAPSLDELFGPFSSNPLLKPETAQSYDVGVEQTLADGTLRVSATVFRRNSKNQISFSQAFLLENISRARAEGLELGLTLKPTDNLEFTANYTLSDAKDRGTGLALLRRPQHSVTASIDWAARDWLKVGAALQSVSDSFDSDFETFERTSLDGYTLVGLRAAVPIGETIELYGRVENLFDEKYETVSGYGTLGRNAHVGVRAKF
ncbi:MAG: TonB-dependent receptor plug domain-containing protein [Sphingomonadaceae bacterium]